MSRGIVLHLRPATIAAPAASCTVELARSTAQITVRGSHVAAKPPCGSCRRGGGTKTRHPPQENTNGFHKLPQGCVPNLVEKGKWRNLLLT